jgi:hypothetical protein
MLKIIHHNSNNKNKNKCPKFEGKIKRRDEGCYRLEESLNRK